MTDLYQSILFALQSADPCQKVESAKACYQAWLAGRLSRDVAAQPLPFRLPRPGQPQRPELVPAFAVPRRGIGSREGHAALLHAIAHIEFNAINLALDAAWRFREMPDEFVTDWLRIAAEEAAHFELLSGRLQALGFAYGDFVAHAGLWEMTVKTDHDVLVRMALVPRVMEARGLDATPPIQKKLWQIGDKESVAVLDIVLHDEIGHVQAGNYWFTWLCGQRGLEPLATFRELLREYAVDALRGAYNLTARKAAGFTDFELKMLEDFAVTHSKSPAWQG